MRGARGAAAHKGLVTAPGGPSHAGVPARVFSIGLVMVAMVGAVHLLGRAFADRQATRVHTPAPTVAPPGVPIAAEADVFRTWPGDVATPPGGRRRQAHPRTLAMSRTLRAYPGAPPRIPHGLTTEEFRNTSCNACHERGGYVARFAAYAPLTPHPEYRACLQCHVPDDAVVGVVIRDHSADAVCLQCHVPGASKSLFVPLDWTAAAWPETNQRAMDGSPPQIPHGFQLRTNCVACHSAPGGVQEIRTTHPERANCRQCHVPAALEEAPFTRDPDVFTRGPGGAF